MTPESGKSGFICCETASRSAPPTSRRSFLTHAAAPALKLGVVFVLPYAGCLAERLFLTRDQEGLADRFRDKAAAIPLFDEAVEIGADLLGKRDVSSGTCSWTNTRISATLSVYAAGAICQAHSERR
jgi:hypothetical protein